MSSVNFAKFLRTPTLTKHFRVAASVLYQQFQISGENAHLVTLLSQPTITCSKLTIETLEQGVKYVQS